MPLMDEFKEEREQVKNRSFKERCAYFWDYYKWHLIGGIALVAIFGSLLYTFLTRKDTAFYAVLMNMYPSLIADEYKEGFAESAGIDLKEYNVFFDSDMRLDPESMNQASVSTSQKMMVYLTAGDIDILVSDTAGMNRYAYTNALMDLRDFLSAEDYEKYEPYFYYMDRALAEAIKESDGDVVFPEDPSDPSTMTDPVPVGIRVNDCQALKTAYFFGDYQYFAVAINTGRPELAHAFLDYIWDVPENP